MTTYNIKPAPEGVSVDMVATVKAMRISRLHFGRWGYRLARLPDRCELIMAQIVSGDPFPPRTARYRRLDTQRVAVTLRRHPV